MAYNPNPELLEETLVQQAKELGTALLADGMKALGGIENDGCMCAEMMPVTTEIFSFAGTALTVETDHGDNFPIHVATYSGGDGYVMIIDGKGSKERAYLGGLIAGAAKAIGFRAIVCDGYVRDRDDCTTERMPVYATGIMQRGPIKKEKGNINVPIRCGGIIVFPGDLVVGDCDGISVVPREKIPQVIEKAREKRDYEIKRVATIHSYEEAREKGEPLPELAPQWVLDMLSQQ